MVKWSAEQFAALSQLLDVALDMEQSARETWIEGLAEPFPGAIPILRTMLARAPSGENAGTFDTLPKLALGASGGSYRGMASEGIQPDGRVGNYRLVQLIGHGGMGEVWLAEQLAPVRRSVALKLIRAAMYDDTVAYRFQAELQSLAVMDHPAIAKVFDAGTTPHGRPYLVMEYVPGVPITEYCDQRKLPIRGRIDLLIQACEGVQHAHQKAIIHRDLKPANILVVEVDGHPVPRIIDFGLAKPTTRPEPGQTLHTQIGQFMGTPGYMSPEQVDQNTNDIDTRGDVYSLGVILYVLLTGLQPFETQSQKLPLHEWLRQLREDEPPNLSAKLSGDCERAAVAAAARATDVKQLTHELRGDLNWITLKAVARERDRRYGTPSDLASDLRRHLNDEPVEARPASAAYQLRKFVRRHRLAAGIVGMFAVLGMVTSAAGLIAFRQKHEAEYQATQALKAQSRLLVQAAAQRLKDSDVANARGIILEVLTNPAFAQAGSSDTMSVFQEIRSADAQLAVLYGHEAEVTSVDYSADGSRIVTASLDGTARIWDALTGQLIATLSGHEGPVWSAAYSPDGTRIVTAGSDKTARIWDASTGATLTVLTGHGDRVYSAAYSPDGNRIVTASMDKSARIWDSRTGAPIATLFGHADRIYTAAFSSDGSRIVTASGDKSARVWDAHTGKALVTLSGRGHEVNSAVYSPDGQYIVTASADDKTQVWDARTGTPLSTMFGNGERANYAAYSPDGTRIVTASSLDANARVWDARTGVQLGVLSGHGESITSAVYSRDGARIVTASYDATARIWDARAGMPLAVLSGHDLTVNSAAYSPDGSHIVTASLDKTARIWDAATGTSQLTLEHGDRVWSAAYSPDNARVITASFDKTARIWDARTGLAEAVLTGHADRVFSAAYSPDGKRIVTGSLDQTARIWDARGGKALAVLIGHSGIVYTAAYSPDGAHIVTASSDKTARIWDAHSGGSLAVLSGHSDDVTSAAYSPDNVHVVTASTDTTARIWEAHAGTPLAVLSGHGDDVHYAAYSPDGRYIVTASDDKTARIWDAGTGMPVAVLSGHADAVTTAVYSPDGTRIVTASVDKTARVWDSSVPASLAAQIVWALSAEADPLSDTTRDKLGLPPSAASRQWSRASACDSAAAAYYDPGRLAPGQTQAAIVGDIAKTACSQEFSRSGHSPRIEYEMGRASVAKHDYPSAKRQFESALSDGYRAAGVDLANLLTNPATDGVDPTRAAALYQRAWQDGVLIGAADLAHLYESGSPDKKPDAWVWYQKGADAGEPTAMARFAERDERDALIETDNAKRSALLLRAFSHYASACVRASEEAWPDPVWRSWRYRRASLARLLARQGMMEQVADRYRAILDKRR